MIYRPQIMAVTVAADGTERLKGYEIVMRRALRRDVEIAIAPDGKVLEGPAKNGNSRRRHWSGAPRPL